MGKTSARSAGGWLFPPKHILTLRALQACHASYLCRTLFFKNNSKIPPTPLLSADLVSNYNGINLKIIIESSWRLRKNLVILINVLVSYLQLQHFGHQLNKIVRPPEVINCFYHAPLWRAFDIFGGYFFPVGTFLKPCSHASFIWRPSLCYQLSQPLVIKSMVGPGFLL